MRIAFASDIHGNLNALQAVIEDIRRREITTVVNFDDTTLGVVI